MTRRNLSAERHGDLVIGIQVISGFMWNFAALEHATIYKSPHGQPSNTHVSRLEMLKGIANLGELGIQHFEELFHPGFQQLHSQQHDVTSCSQAAMIYLATDVAGKVTQTQLDDDDKQCLRDLRVTDPRDDKSRIEASKDHLLEGSCSWVFEDPAFVEWWPNDESYLLWLHGDPGKGKMMNMIAIISEISKTLETLPGPNVLTYFFCQNTFADHNSTVALLRGLIFLLVDQDKTLVRHLRRSYDSVGKQMFEGPNAHHALWRVLRDILKDDRLGKVYLMADALDECDEHVLNLLDWITRDDSGIPPKTKWLTTSRNEPALTERLGNSRHLHISLELNATHITSAVNRSIDSKVKELADIKHYKPELQESVTEYLLHNANGTFLWAALVYRELLQVKAYKVPDLLQKIPPGLDSLYARMLDQVRLQRDPEDAILCQRLLRLVILSFRSLRLDEIAFLAGFPEHFQDAQAMRDLVSLCGSFLVIRIPRFRGEFGNPLTKFDKGLIQTVQEDLMQAWSEVSLVHQSAKDFFSVGRGTTIFKSGLEPEHAIMAHRCLVLTLEGLEKAIWYLEIPSRLKKT